MFFYFKFYSKQNEAKIPNGFKGRATGMTHVRS